ncbi:hypothetical protein K0B96_14810 [Horticoccus luteus]|uniref:Alpha-D-xyloside xylohydrolase n=1 Tax=Horticoccus luteus TaxID=2862869 RepID=A0A8F9TSS3_9BACT|nr:TIM-barrel domain-containing protein [Horticoccus luteus]QYM78554.1 hypothetical protein K0B96_14810 [Horticoccus luteus]
MKKSWFAQAWWLVAGLMSAGHVWAGITLTESPHDFRCANGETVLIIEREPWRLRIATAHDETRVADADAPALKIGDAWVALARADSAKAESADVVRVAASLANGARATAEVRPYGANGFRVIVRAADGGVTGVRGATMLHPMEEIYGFGEMWNGHVAQRGQAFDLWDIGGTPDECAYMPYYVSTRNYAFLLNYGGRVHFDVGQRRADQLTYEAPAGELDLTFVAGDSIATTVRHFLTEAGLPQRPPRWTFQPWFWLMADPSQPGAKIDTLKGEHFIEMVDKLHAMGLPIGATWFEPPWQDARSSFKPNPAFSADLKGLIAQLRAKGVRSLAWTVPYTTDKASNWKEAVAKGYLAQKPDGDTSGGDVKITASGELEGKYYNAIDFFNPAAAKWWEAQIDRALDLGLAGFKLDAGQDLPEDARLFGGREGRDVHNSYALEFNKVFFEALQKRLGDDFLMVPRAAWVGSGAYTNFKWPGDLAGSFANNGLPSSVYSSLSLAFCGLPFLSTDIGGFENQPAPEDAWLRWAQFGAMLPGMQTLHMPWWYSEEAQTHFRYLAWLHTDLTPLWMSLAHEAAATGAPVCRPLVWSFQDDMATWRVDDEFTVGTSLLVAPMLNMNPDRKVYLPAGRWFDFWDENESYQGPVTIDWFKGWFVKDKFPLFVREGAIIPMEIANDVTGFGTAASKGYVTLAIWPKAGGQSEFVLHDTEGPVRITTDARQANAFVVGWDATKRNHLLRIHDADAHRPVSVTADGAKLAAFDTLAAFQAGGEGWFYDATKRNIWVRKHNSGAAGAVSLTWAPAATTEDKR